MSQISVKQIDFSGGIPLGTGSLFISGGIEVSGGIADFSQTTQVTGSFVGDGSGLTGVTAEWDGTHVGNAEISGSLIVSSSINTAPLNVQEIILDVDYDQSGDLNRTTGKIFWDSLNSTLGVHLRGDDVTLQVGQEIHIFARNNSGDDISNGDIVTIYGSSGNKVVIKKAISTPHGNGGKGELVGVATEDISNNSDGYVTMFGTVRNLNTNDFIEGDTVYLSHITSGSLIQTKPPAPYATVPVGLVESKHVTHGKLFVHPVEPSHLHDLTGVTGSDYATAGQVLMKDPNGNNWFVFSNQFTGSFSGSFEGPSGIFRQTGSVYSATEDVELTGSLKIDGTLIADVVQASTIFFSSSEASFELVSFSGSTEFGDTLDDLHRFTGSAYITGSLTVDGDVTIYGEITHEMAGTADQFVYNDSNKQIKYVNASTSGLLQYSESVFISSNQLDGGDF